MHYISLNSKKANSSDLQKPVCYLCASDTIETRRIEKSQINYCNNCGLVWRETMVTAFAEDESKALWGKRKNLNKYCNLIRDLVGPDFGNLAELGAGDGSFYITAKKYSQKYTVFDIVDFDIPGVDYIKCNFEIDDLGDEKYNTIVAFDLLEHIRNIGDFFRRVNKSLKYGGVFIVETGDGESVWNEKMNWYLDDKSHKTFITKKLIKFIAELYGFDIELLVLRRHKSTTTCKIKNFIQLLASLLPQKFILLISKNEQRIWNPYKFNHAFIILRKIN